MSLRFLPILLLSAARTWSQGPAIPDTPAGHTLQAWLDAFNSGDRARIQAYIAKYEPTGAVDETLGFRDQTGGFDLLGIDKSQRLHIEFRVKEKASPTTAVGKIDVSDADPAVVTSFGLRAIPPGMTGGMARRPKLVTTAGSASLTSIFPTAVVGLAFSLTRNSMCKRWLLSMPSKSNPPV